MRNILSIYAFSDYEISETMKLYVGKRVHWLQYS